MMLKRWWIYQKERFPVFKNGLLIAVFSGSAVSYSVLLRGGKALNFDSLIVAFISIFFFFLQLRIADEFKDFEDDARYRSYRPVPRGLVSLKELGIIGVVSVIIQLGLALSLSPNLAILLAIVLSYMGLMSQEFFVRDWLKAHPVVYMGSHAVIVPLINLYGTACDWLVAEKAMPDGLVWFLGASFFNGMAIEIGRKIRSPEAEELGVETYSALWGRRNAVFAWLGVLGSGAIASFFAASQINFAAPVGGLLVIMLASAGAIAYTFLKQPISKWANSIDGMSGVWTLLLYLGVGIIPLCLRL